MYVRISLALLLLLTTAATSNADGFDAADILINEQLAPGQLKQDAQPVSTYDFSGLCNGGFRPHVTINMTDVTVGSTATFHTTLPAQFPECGASTSSTGIWATYTGTGDTVTIASFGSTFDTYLKVYHCQGPGYYQEECVGSNDDCFGTLQSAVSFYAEKGHTYQIFLSGYFNTNGNYALSIQTGDTYCGFDDTSDDFY